MRDHADVATTLACDDLGAAVHAYTQHRGFRVRTIFPADAPRWAVLVRGDERLLLVERGVEDVGVADAEPVDVHVAPTRHLARMAQSWGTGRAGMQYRDLLPDRAGGAFIVSHIRMPDGGEVPDYVHFHEVRFQVICCVAGWVEVVYEDQGPPFVMRAGDCVVQPPTIRHRVLRASAGLEVLEVGSPAAHLTHGDLELTLPTGSRRPERRFEGQRFVRHEAAQAVWQGVASSDWQMADTGIGAATGGVVDVRMFRPGRAAGTRRPWLELAPDRELFSWFVMAGEVELDEAGAVVSTRLQRGDAFTVPTGHAHRFEAPSPDLQLVLVSGDFSRQPQSTMCTS